MIFDAAVVIAGAIIISALTRLIYHVRPKKAFAQVVVGGVTDSDGEAFQATLTLFPDETPNQWRKKLLQVYELREWRLKYQNERMLQIQEEAKRQFEEAKACGQIQAVKS